VVNNFSTTILRGDRVGILGANGCGKTTLLRLLLGQLTPTSGTVKLGTNLQIAYFDQLRAQLDEKKSVQDNVADGHDHVTIGGKPRHIISYLQDFLFAPDRARSPVKSLSGGERNRLLLARLFSQPSNVLVLDEPTNDLDVETLDMLEERLMEYSGTLILVSHDRDFIDNVVTSTIVFEGDGEINEYVGGYSDWLRQSQSLQEKPKPAARSSSGKKSQGSSKGITPPRKLSFNEQRELAAIPLEIEQLEAELARLEATMGDSRFYQNDKTVIADATTRLQQLKAILLEKYARWEGLEAAANGDG
jgi:ATP-binding cassette subfamily F protein uup